MSFTVAGAWRTGMRHMTVDTTTHLAVQRAGLPATTPSAAQGGACSTQASQLHIRDRLPGVDGNSAQVRSVAMGEYGGLHHLSVGLATDPAGGHLLSRGRP